MHLHFCVEVCLMIQGLSLIGSSSIQYQCILVFRISILKIRFQITLKWFFQKQLRTWMTWLDITLKSYINTCKHNQSPIGSMYAIYGNIYHQYTPNVSINLPYMDPSWVIIIWKVLWNHLKGPSSGQSFPTRGATGPKNLPLRQGSTGLEGQGRQQVLASESKTSERTRKTQWKAS